MIGIVQNVNPRQLSLALGWFWTVYSIGIGLTGSFIPSLTIPLIGEFGTLCLSLALTVSGALIALLGLKNLRNSDKANLSAKEKFGELLLAVTLLRNPQITYAALIRVINTLAFFGFAVIMPMMFVKELNWPIEDWLHVWALYFFANIIANVLWGKLSEIFGWMNIICYVGCLGSVFAILAFYLVPQAHPDSFFLACIPSVIPSMTIGSFVPLTAVMTNLEPEHEGAAISICNLAGGASNSTAPALAAIILPFFGVQGVVYVYAALYLVAFGLCFLIKVKQPGFNGVFKPRDPVEVTAVSESANSANSANAANKE